MLRNGLNTIAIVLLIFNYISPQQAIIPKEPDKNSYLDILGEIQVLNRIGKSIDELIDGNTVTLKIIITDPPESNWSILFFIDGTQVADCVIPAGKKECTSEKFLSLGWYWDSSGASAPERTLSATTKDQEISSRKIQIKPRPVVMVYGLTSSWEAWKNYLGPLGFLAKVGLSGFAVGDGQVEGVMNLGNLGNPTGRTNTIHQNAQIVADYIQRVKQLTGAEMVDLIGHSMGGLIARDYIGTIMSDRDISQLIMLGSPMAGTDCVDLPASLGLYLPATLEIRPSYVVGVFNRRVTERHGIAFHALAGNPIQDAFKSPCTSVPTDIVVSLGSVTAIPLESTQMAILHQDMNLSKKAFDEFVLPLLQYSIQDFTQEQVEIPESIPSAPLQFTRIFTGQIAPNESTDVVIHIEKGVSVASFALYDTSRTLAVTVRGASGNVIDLTPDKNGLVVVKDPSSLFYLGYGFNNPKPGIWRVTISATPQTPNEGAKYAITAYMVGGAVLNAFAEPILPELNGSVQLKADLVLNNEPIPIDTAQASIRKPDGQIDQISLEFKGNQAQANFKPDLPGIYAIDLTIGGKLADGTPIERTAFLTVETQAERSSSQAGRWIILIGIICVGAILLGFILVFRFLPRKRYKLKP